jgi:hypothetical protein
MAGFALSLRGVKRETSVKQRRTLPATDKEGEKTMMRQSETMRAASRLLQSHPIVCLLAALAAGVVLGVLGPIKVVHADDVALKIQGENFAPPPTGTTRVSGAGYDVGAALKFNQNVTASTTVNCSAVCDVTLWAQGGQSGGRASLSVNGSPAPPAQTLTTNTVQPYTFHANLPAGGAELRVTASGTGTGHNAILDYVTFPASGSPPASGGPPPPAQCNDTIDNDGDGQIDFPNDQGCSSATDTDEANAPPPAQCNDTIDNDGDGLIDFPNDQGCSSATDNDETNATGTTARLVGAGDIATNGSADTATGDLIDARPDARVFTAGDNAYPNGTASDFTTKYEPAWGPFKNRTSPSPGNHDYVTSGASGYKNYFGSGSVAGLRSVNPTYYAYTLGAWRVYALDSNISMAIGSPQYNFVQDDLIRDESLCELAYWHHPIASSGEHGNNARARPIFELFDAQGGDLVLNGHDHNYERFTKIDSLGRPSASGVRQIIVGTGGTSLRGQSFVQPGSELRNFDTHGIVDINLSSTGYSGTFVPAPGFGSFTDSPDLGFEGTCGTT